MSELILAGEHEEPKVALQVSRAKQVLTLPAGTVVVEAFRPETD